MVPYKHAHTHLDFEYFQNINEDKTLFFSSSQHQRFFFFLSVSKVFLLPLSNKGFLNFVKKLQFGDFWRNLVVFGEKAPIWRFLEKKDNLVIVRVHPGPLVLRKSFGAERKKLLEKTR